MPKLISVPRQDRKLSAVTNGCVLYHGESPFVEHENNQFVALMTFHSTNTKTGPMAQIYLLVDSIKPTEAKKQGLASVVCGDCPLIESCYVNLGRGVQQVWKSYKAGSYAVYTPSVHNEYIKRFGVRFGAYGDPSLLPIELVQRLASISDGKWTGYTHQWEKPQYQAYRPYFMASVHDEITPEDDIRATALGWRHYRVGTDGPRPGEVLCPNSNESLPRVVQCGNCFACDGANRAIGQRQRVNIYNPPSGKMHAKQRWINSIPAMQERAKK